jgi:hypothetical protein
MSTSSFNLINKQKPKITYANLYKNRKKNCITPIKQRDYYTQNSSFNDISYKGLYSSKNKSKNKKRNTNK